MVENKSSLFGIIAIIIGASGLGLGAFSLVNFQVIEGPQGIPGDDGQEGQDGTDGQDGIDGKDAPGGIIVGIMDPDEGDIISGNVTIRVMVASSEDYTISILRNSTEIGTSLPMTWNTETVSDGWWNITIIATDIATNNKSQDEVKVYVQNVEDPTNIYYCSSQTEIEDALDTINIGHGTIIITKDITLTSTINIDGGGRYIIQGVGPVTIDRNANDETFYITNVQSLTLKDLIINTTDIFSSTMQGIFVNEGNDNPVYIQNVQIGGGGESRGIFADSENVWIENCVIHDVRVGIYLGSGSAYCHILDNSLFDMSVSSGDVFGIYVGLDGSANTISGNVVYTISSGNGDAVGILSEGNFNSINSNTVYGVSSSTGGNAYGIFLYDSDYNSIIGNVVRAISSSDYAYGIYLYYSDLNSISGNRVYDISAVEEAIGILLYSSHSNTISGNVVYNITSPNSAYGIFFYMSDFNNISNNTFTTIIGGFTSNGIYVGGDYNVIVGNTLENCGNGIADTGTGNVVDHNVVV